MEKHSALLKHGHSYHDLNDMQRFLVKQTMKDLDIFANSDNNMYHPSYVYFGQAGVEALAWIHCEGDIIFLKDYYIRQKKSAKKYMIMILAKVIFELNQNSGAAKQIALQIDSNSLYTCLIDIIGKPKQDQLITEYVKML